MRTIIRTFRELGLILAIGLLAVPAFAGGTGEHTHIDEDQQMLEQMRRHHEGHEHGHDFDVMEEMSPEKLARVLAAMREIGLGVPPMDASRGRKLFVETGCVVCHSVNNVGGQIAPSLDAAEMPSPMNAFEFAARMWRGASAMTQMQEDLFGEPISLTGQDLADLVAFAHDIEEQEKLTEDQIPVRVWMPPVLQADFSTFWQGFNRSCVRPRNVACLTPRAGMLFGRQGPHRFREL